ncbi:hypothetical protein WJX72_007806 [[Myrmecia] bisecta]|uniref:Coiled-coil domain-containing protein 61 n=1 Tax=[Myrmecia] bisecta TaxID=41462 RepID=A0AAW1PQB4_9CHLO
MLQKRGVALQTDRKVEVSFQDVAYFVTVTANADDTLCIEVEQKQDAQCWKGTFPAKHIQEITAKTGNFKKYAIFVKMLLTALKQESDSVFVDLLTYADLEQLRARRGLSEPPLSHLSPPQNKRYLILTYAAEFDRVHYPLPLLYEEHPDPERLQLIICQLRAELEALQQAAGPGDRKASNVAADMRRLREENASLRQQVKLAEAQAGVAAPSQEHATAEAREAARELRLVRKERDLLQQRAESAEAEVERERSLKRRELRRAAKESADLMQELAHAREHVRELRLKCRDLAQQAELSQRSSRALRPAPTRSRYPSENDRPRSVPHPRPVSARTSSPSRRPTSTATISPASTRPASPPLTTRQTRLPTGGGASPQPARPRSAPSRGRFDPTEYVKQKLEREREVSARLRRRPSLPSSRPPSGQSTPTRSRASSVERGRGSSRPSSAGSSRAGSAERPRPYAQQRAASPAFSGGGQIRGQPRSHPQSLEWLENQPKLANMRPANVCPSREERAASPGRALRDVKAKLNQYAAQQHGLLETREGHSDIVKSAPEITAETSSAGLPALPTKPDVFHNATAEIADIDSRLHALQTFLKAAKASAAPKVSS